MSKRLTTNEFIKRANKKHNKKFDYSLVNYVNNRIKVIIICPIHGKFLQTPDAHMSGKGCKLCNNLSKRSSIDDFIEKANAIHNNKFTYSKSRYVINSKKIIITCPIHGDFLQTPNSHLAGIGCSKCGKDVFKLKMSKTTHEFIKESIIIHKNKYDYSHVNYKNNATKVKIYCKECKEFFFQSPNVHLNSSGCWKCNHVSVFSRTKWNDLCNSKNCIPIVYVIRCFNELESFIKIGRTMQSIHRRFCSKLTMPYEYEVIKEIKGSSNFIFDKECELHSLYKNSKYIPDIPFAGKYECFNISILQDILKHS